jgi:hypothetical protein
LVLCHSARINAGWKRIGEDVKLQPVGVFPRSPPIAVISLNKTMPTF